jgi:hypothetical protein
MRVSRKLSELLIKDIAEWRGAPTKFKDRLTQAEAKELLEWGKKQPEVIRAYADKGHKNHEAFRVYASLLNHFADAHPQDAAGAPAAWPERTAPRTAEPTKENPFAHLDADEAEAILTWAKTRPEYGGYYDPKDPKHADLVSQTAQLMAIIHPEPGSPKPQGDSMVAQTLSIALEKIEKLRKDPAYTDKQNPKHGEAVAAVTRAYEEAYGGKPAAAAIPKSASESNPSARSSIAELQKNPAYWNKNSPDHGKAVEAMSAAYEAAQSEAATQAASSKS